MANDPTINHALPERTPPLPEFYGDPPPQSAIKSDTHTPPRLHEAVREMCLAARSYLDN